MHGKSDVFDVFSLGDCPATGNCHSRAWPDKAAKSDNNHSSPLLACNHLYKALCNYKTGNMVRHFSNVGIGKLYRLGVLLARLHKHDIFLSV